MARGASEILGELHKIICRRATDQMLFAYVRGAQAANQSVSIEAAIRSFCDCFGVDINQGTARSSYYRMLNEGRNDAQTLKDQMQV